MAGFRPEMESCPCLWSLSFLHHSCFLRAKSNWFHPGTPCLSYNQSHSGYLQLWTHPRDPPGSDHSLQYLRCLLLLLALYLRPPSLFFSLMPIRCLTGRPFSDHSVLFAFHTTRAFYLRSVCFTMSSQEVIILWTIKNEDIKKGCRSSPIPLRCHSTCRSGSLSWSIPNCLLQKESPVLLSLCPMVLS